ncbi:MAG: flagellar basal body L-ring protein FlgH [Phycisphaerales bacterium]|nr:flagellar basal body L-ring protein FlgH [Phycisphaerales bacterium]
MTRSLFITGSLVAVLGSTSVAQDRPVPAAPARAAAPSGSRLVAAIDEDARLAALQFNSDDADTNLMFVPLPRARAFSRHDLVQIIVRETSSAKSSQELETKKDWSMDGKVAAWPGSSLSQLLQLQATAGRTTNLPAVDLEFNKNFKGEGDYARKDDFTARVTAEVVDVLPNGNLILEARTFIKTDAEEATMRVTGICRAEDISVANTVLSSQIHDLHVEKMHSGELKKTAEKGIIAKVFEAVFAF